MSFVRWIALALLLAANPVLGEEAEVADPAREAAMEWLALVDAGDYAQSWTQASALLQQQVSQEAWVEALGITRQPLGDVLSREVTRVDHVTELPNVPDGEYAVLQFKTRFADRESAAEMVTPSLEDGEWKVAGYYIR
ncbi:MAG: DUF4019 domain-containing protein [Anaerolineae bacterium]